MCYNIDKGRKDKERERENEIKGERERSNEQVLMRDEWVLFSIAPFTRGKPFFFNPVRFLLCFLSSFLSSEREKKEKRKGGEEREEEGKPRNSGFRKTRKMSRLDFDEKRERTSQEVEK